MNNNTLYKIVTRAEWQTAQQTGSIPLSPTDVKDGFIHLSTADQYITSANLYFNPEDQPLVIELDGKRLTGDVRWEWSDQRQADFPHLYDGTLRLSAANATVSLHATKDGYTIQSRTIIHPSGKPR